MQQQAAGSFNTPPVPHSSTGLQPPAPIRYPWQVSEGVHSLATTPGITQDTASGHTPGILSGMGPGAVTGRAPGIVPGSTLDQFCDIVSHGSTPAITPGTIPYTPYTTGDIVPDSISSTTTSIAPRISPYNAPGSCNTTRMDLVAAAPGSNHAPSTTKVPRQVVTLRQHPILQSQKRKGSVIAASLGTQQDTIRPKSHTANEPFHRHTLQHNTTVPQQQVDLSPPMPVPGVHQPLSDDTAAQSSGKRRRKKLLQQSVLPFQTANGEPVTAPAKPLVPAKSRTKKPHKQPVSLVAVLHST